MAENTWIEEGLAIYRQTQTSRVWWVRMRICKQEVRLSLKVQDKAEAYKKALKLKGSYELAAEQGMELNILKTRLSVVIEKVIANITGAQNKSDNTKVIVRVLNSISEGYGKTDTSKIDNQFLIDYYNAISFNDTLLTNTNFAWRLIIEYLADYKLNDKNLRIPKKVETKQKKRRDHFEKTEKELILSSIDSFIEASGNYKTRQIRHVLKAVIHFMLLSGVRPGEEIFGIRLEDITVSKVAYDYEVLVNITKGKTEKRLGREIRVSSDILPIFEELCELKFGVGLNEARKRYKRRHLFFVQYEGKPETKPALNDPFSKLIGYVQSISDVEIKDNHNFTPYSLRHTYITEKLLNSKAKISEIALHCGTSVEMIEGTYQHILSRMVHDNLESDRLTDEERAMKEYRIYSS
ncbi:site-specific integrase [Pontibacterium granulatum]|uniref:site-specific integrase n=1 Tax=Pontibacterium granulatum TaxID=2036029 RepID=UPI00249BA620|nr:site-specific integrase [Pontibacterium granulatum]MDI3323846.1 site-specific integrase [Pontibacterium granulatum]